MVLDEVDDVLTVAHRAGQGAVDLIGNLEDLVTIPVNYAISAMKPISIKDLNSLHAMQLYKTVQYTRI